MRERKFGLSSGGQIKHTLFCLLVIFLMTLFACGDTAHAMQDKDGQPPPGPQPTRQGPKPRTRKVLRPVIRSSPARGRPNYKVTAPEPPPGCEDGEIVVRCGLPGCDVVVDGSSQGLTDGSGEMILPALSGSYIVEVSKPGYERVPPQKVDLGCSATRSVDVRLKARTVALRIRTNLPDCELYVNGQPNSIGRTNSEGLFNYTLNTPEFLIEARKSGHLSANQHVTVASIGAQNEVSLTLKPIPARLNLSANVEGARARIDNRGSYSSLSEPISIAPGHRQVTVDAFGYAPVTFELTAAPGETVKKSVSLQRMPATKLAAEAEALYKARAYENVLILCKYILEVEAEHPTAHRLTGLAYLVRQDFAKAESHLARALAGNESITLPVRRHPRENFELNKGHDVCEAELVLNKSELEFRGLRAPIDNFKVYYGQVQVIGIQLKKNAAVFLGTKVTDARGKKQDFNFYSFDKELTQSGRAYLEMLQRLLRAH